VQLNAVIDHRIRVQADALPDVLACQIAEALTFENLEREEARKQRTAGWQDLPTHIELFAINGNEVSFPRGFRHAFEAGLQAHGMEVSYEDRRTSHTQFRLGQPIAPRDHQPAAVEAIKRHQDLIYKAPTGSGKTITSLLAIRSLAQRSLVIVNTLAIAEQWVDRAREALGEHYPVTMIGDGKLEVSPYLTIATAQSLWSRRDQLLADGVFDCFGAVVLDECHHATALTYMALLDRFSARWRWGVSATPDKTGDFRIATNVLGPVLHETPLQEMFDKGYLIKPRAVKIETGFGSHYKRARRVNYNKLVGELSDHPLRNLAIARNIKRNEGSHQLILSARLAQLDAIRDLLLEEGFKDGVYWLTGRETRAERETLQANVEAGPCVVFSTIANEAVDIPVLERVHLAWPQKNTGLIIQQIGRVMRNLPGKQVPVIFDYTDTQVGVLSAQWTGRMHEVYLRLEIPIERFPVGELLQDAVLS
jgi:superfamily II DNA or RNA helicase